MDWREQTALNTFSYAKYSNTSDSLMKTMLVTQAYKWIALILKKRMEQVKQIESGMNKSWQKNFTPEQVKYKIMIEG